MKYKTDKSLKSKAFYAGDYLTSRGNYIATRNNF